MDALSTQQGAAEVNIGQLVNTEGPAADRVIDGLVRSYARLHGLPLVVNNGNYSFTTQTRVRPDYSEVSIMHSGKKTKVWALGNQAFIQDFQAYAAQHTSEHAVAHSQHHFARDAVRVIGGTIVVLGLVYGAAHLKETMSSNDYNTPRATQNR